MTTTTLINGPNTAQTGHALWNDATDWSNGLPSNGGDVVLSVSGIDNLAAVTSLGTVALGRDVSSAIIETPLAIDTLTSTSGGFILDYSTLSVGQPASNVGFVLPGGDLATLGSLAGIADIYQNSTLYVQGTVADSASILIDGGSTLELGTATGLLNASVDYNGSSVIELAATRLIGASFYFGSSTELTLTTDAGTLTLANFVDQTTTPPTGLRTAIDPATNLLQMTFVTSSGNGITPIQTSSAPPPAPTPTPGSGTGTTGTSGTGTPACYVRGTMIAVADGERPIETLRAGDLVRTASGALRPVRWLARRAYSAGELDAMSGDARPVRLRAGALAPGVPSRDLVISPEHALLLDGVLVPASALVNAMSILREPAGDVEYLHVELDSHDALLASGACCESFSDCDNFHLFENAAERMLVAAPPWTFCAPRLAAGAASEAVRLRLARRAAPDGPLLACGARLVAGRASGPAKWRFDLDGDEATLRLLSPSLVPALLGLGADQRRLGVPVRSVAFEAPGGRWTMALDDGQPVEGWHVFETTHRWTDGDAVLPTGARQGAARARELEVTLAAGAEMAWQAKIG